MYVVGMVARHKHATQQLQVLAQKSRFVLRSTLCMLARQLCLASGAFSSVWLLPHEHRRMVCMRAKCSVSALTYIAHAKYNPTFST
jgi:hypothetical protein